MCSLSLLIHCLPVPSYLTSPPPTSGLTALTSDGFGNVTCTLPSQVHLFACPPLWEQSYNTNTLATVSSYSWVTLRSSAYLSSPGQWALLSSSTPHPAHLFPCLSTPGLCKWSHHPHHFIASLEPVNYSTNRCTITMEILLIVSIWAIVKY
jgi:hypothetical protein